MWPKGDGLAAPFYISKSVQLQLKSSNFAAAKKFRCNNTNLSFIGCLPAVY